MTNLNNMRVLYVEDDRETRNAFSQFLKSRVGKLYTADCGERGLEKFTECKPHILIADLIMPGMSGLEMIKEIRRQNRFCRIIITTTVSELDTVLGAVDSGIDHYIIKPVDTAEFLEKLEGMASSVLQALKGSQTRFSFDTVRNRGEIENDIRIGFLKILKSRLGKGPQDIKVLLYENKVELTAVDAMTPMEKTLTANRKNVAVVEHFRELFYDAINLELAALIESVTGKQSLFSIEEIDALKRIDRIRLTIV